MSSIKVLPATALVFLFCACPQTSPADGGAGGGAATGGGSAGGGGLGGGTGGGTDAGGGAGGGSGGGGGGTLLPLVGPRSASVAVDANARVWAVNPELPALLQTAVTGSSVVSFPLFAAGAMPSSLAISSDALTGWVTLRKHQQLVKVSLSPAAPSVVAQVTVCSEPTGVALSPNGRFAVVACFGEPAAVVVDTATLSTTRVALPDVARAVAITHDGDAEDTDESAYVTLFYGARVAEGKDSGRIGKVVEISLGATPQVSATLDLKPIADTGFGVPQADGGEGPVVGCAPNQLFAIAITGRRAFVPHTCVSPQAPVNRLTTLFAGLSVLDLDSKTEVAGIALSKVMRTQGLANDSLLGVPIDVVAEPNFTVHVLSQAANRVASFRAAPGQPLVLLRSASPDAGTTTDLFGNGCGYLGCTDGGAAQNDGGFVDPRFSRLAGVPIGLAKTSTGLFVNDWTGHALIPVLNTAPNQYQADAPRNFGPLPSDITELLGKKFFFTGRDRWAFREVGSCGSCHPDGLSDNVTWVFPAGPRQTPSLDGTFAKGDRTDHRAQNWTGVFDEIYDVEGVTRGVLGGKGAITQGPLGQDTPVSLTAGVTFDGGLHHRNDALSGSTRAVVNALGTVRDWDELERYAENVHANRAPVARDAGAVARGRLVFEAAGCAGCHGGKKWTVSRIPYFPSPEKNGSLVGDNGLPAMPTGLRTELRNGGTLPGLNSDTFKLATEKFANPDGGAMVTVGPERITCVLRDVGTFDDSQGFERKADGTLAQGTLGYNPPSLFGLATSAPYLHHGGAASLEALFAPKFARHHQAGDAGFLAQGGTTPAEAAQRADLIEFLESIDEDTAPFSSATLVDICGTY